MNMAWQQRLQRLTKPRHLSLARAGLVAAGAHSCQHLSLAEMLRIIAFATATRPPNRASHGLRRTGRPHRPRRPNLSKRSTSGMRLQQHQRRSTGSLCSRLLRQDIHVECAGHYAPVDDGDLLHLNVLPYHVQRAGAERDAVLCCMQLVSRHNIDAATWKRGGRRAAMA